MSKLALGTANFGLEYGVKNLHTKLSDSEIGDIIKVANEAGIKTVDTAQAYGNCEQRLAPLLNSKFEIVTKVGWEEGKNYHSGSIFDAVCESIKNLNVSSLYGLLLHRPEMLLTVHGDQIITELKLLKEKGLVEKVGISIYSPDPLYDIVNKFDPDIVQAPFNVFDRRIYESGWAEKIKTRGAELHVRSVFLQGLLLMQEDELPEFFYNNWSHIFKKWFTFLDQVGLRPDLVALSIALKEAWIDKVVVGVDNSNQLRRLASFQDSQGVIPNPNFSVSDLNLIDPSRWKIK